MSATPISPLSGRSVANIGTVTDTHTICVFGAFAGGKSGRALTSISLRAEKCVLLWSMELAKI